MVSYFTGWPGLDSPLADGQTPVVLNAVVAVLTLLVRVGVVVLAFRAPRLPRLASLAFLLVGGFPAR